MFETLRNHAVFRAATIYAIAGWLLIQFADITLEAFDAPDWIMRATLWLVLTGFPVVLGMSWLANRASLDGPANTAIALITLLLAVFASGVTYVYWSNDSLVIATDSKSRQKNPVVAILPFENLSSDKENEFLADGMVEDIITVLSQSPGVQVIARNSTFKYKGTNPDIREVGADLNADYVAEGSIRPVGDRLRVTIQVIDTQNGAHIWAEKYDRQLTNFFALQDELSLGIAAAVGDAVFRTEYQSINQSRTDNLSVWALTSRADVNTNTELFGFEDIENVRRAIKLDPDYALAHAVLGRSLSLWTTFYTNDSLENHPFHIEAEKAARTAKRLAPNDPKVQAYLAVTLLWCGKPEEALHASERVPKMSPGYAEGLAYHADILIHNGMAEEAIPLLEKAIALTPNAPQLGLYNIMLGEGYVIIGNWEKAESTMREALNHYGGANQYPLRYLAGVQLQLGKEEDAIRMLRRSFEVGVDRPLTQDKAVLAFYTVKSTHPNFLKIFDDLIALQKKANLK
jgi:TolB-like protein/Flp pilus assembly protein TadD